MDRLEGMAVFVKAADSGSFAAAGVALGLSAQMVGKHVGAIEARLGARLLNRTTRRQSLTEVGRLYYERCRAALAEVEAADAAATDLMAAPRGRLRVTAPVTFGAHSLTPVIAKYLRANPEVEVDLSLTDRFVDLIEEGYEAAIRLGPLTDSSLVARSLAPYRLAACAAPAYLAAHGEPKTPEDLADHACLSFTYWARPSDTEWLFTRDGVAHVAKVSSRFRVNDARAQLAAAREGVGVILGAEAMLREDIASGRLVRLLPDYEGPSRAVHIIFPSDRRPTPKLRAFVDLVVAELGRPN